MEGIARTEMSVTSRDGTRIAYDRSGAGPALILIGGAFQFRAFDQRTVQLAVLLAQRFTVYHYDRRGRGQSGDTEPYAVDREVEDLAALIAAAGGSSLVFGMSSGAVLALRAAAARLPITGLALYEPPFNGGDPAALTAAREYGRKLTAHLAAGRRADAVVLAMTTFGTPPEMIAGMRQSPAWPTFESIAHTLAYDNAVMGDGSVPTALATAVSVPVTVLDGGSSPPFLRDAARATAAALPRGSHRTLEGQTHAYAPEVLAPALVECLLGT